MGLMDTLRQRVLKFLMPDEYSDTDYRDRMINMERLSAYYNGDQARQIKVKPRQADDNITLNYTRLIVERGVSMLIGGGVEFDMEGDGESPEQMLVDAIWEANRQDALLHAAAQYAAIYGTGYFKIVPGSRVYGSVVYPRLVALDPRWLKIESAPEDIETVTAYESRFRIVRDGEEVNRKERIERQTVEADGGERVTGWLVLNYEADRAGKWELVDETEWPFDFAPIVHWQNLPMAGSVYGDSDISDVVELQDRVNFVAGNISRIIRYHAHPKTWGRQAGSSSNISWGADEMVIYNSPDAMLQNLEMQSDLSSSAAYLLSLRQSMFDIARTVDISSVADKLGALTNFGLRVLYTDSLAKLHSKQALMGEALMEVNRRLQIIEGVADAQPGKVNWPDNLPANEMEELQAAQLELGLGTVSKETVARERGRDWESEQERIDGEKAAGDNVGAMLLRNFNNGQGF